MYLFQQCFLIQNRKGGLWRETFDWLSFVGISPINCTQELIVDLATMSGGKQCELLRLKSNLSKVMQLYSNVVCTHLAVHVPICLATKIQFWTTSSRDVVFLPRLQF